MNKRLLILVALLLLTCGYAYFYWYTPARSAPADPFALSPIVQATDEFDSPYQSDPELVKEFANKKLAFPFAAGDRVAWIGSSSTYIGVWTRTMEFLLRSRHPELKLTFARHSTGGGTYATGAARLPDWLERSKPTLVFFNFGANDAAWGKRWLGDFHLAMRTCTELVQKSGARVIQIAHQSGDIRATGPIPYYRRKHYADDMLAFSTENGWNAVDVFHPLDELQTKAQAENDAFTINSDIVHMTDSAYVAWAFYLYDRLNPPDGISSLTIDAPSKQIVEAKNCRARLMPSDDGIVFEREDSVLPILPPDPLPEDNSYRGRITSSYAAAMPDFISTNDEKLPPRKYVPMEARSNYLLKITGLIPGDYAVECGGKPVGKATEKELANGVNLNTLVLDAGVEAPWKYLADMLWSGMDVEELYGRKLVFKVQRIVPAK